MIASENEKKFINFMNYFYSDDYDNLNDGLKESIFLNSLTGSSDITKELLQKLCNNYGTTLEEVLNKKGE